MPKMWAGGLKSSLAQGRSDEKQLTKHLIEKTEASYAIIQYPYYDTLM